METLSTTPLESKEVICIRILYAKIKKLEQILLDRNIIQQNDLIKFLEVLPLSNLEDNKPVTFK